MSVAIGEIVFCKESCVRGFLKGLEPQALTCTVRKTTSLATPTGQSASRHLESSGKIEVTTRISEPV